MFGKSRLQKMKVMVALAAVLAGGVMLGAPDKASADYADILGAPNGGRTLRTPLIPGASFANQMEAAPEGQPPPIGDGNNPVPVVQGDQNLIPPPTGTVDMTHGNIFPTRNAPGPKPPTIYVPDAGRHQTKNGQQQGVFDFGQEEKGTGTSDVLFQHQVQPNRYNFEGPLPTVRTFCHYLVVLGVVAATVFMSMAAMAMCMGSQYGGSRVIGAAGGLLLLLAGYTIWKIVELNTMHANSTGWESHYRNGQAQPLQERGGQPQQTGGNPFAGGGAPNNAGGGGNPFGGGGAPTGGGGGGGLNNPLNNPLNAPGG